MFGESIYRSLGNGFFPGGMFLGPWILILVVVDLVLKGIALYRAARNEQKYWFIALLVINSAGILPLIYLLCCSKKGKKK